uniref:Uncharacterized protein n=1 Tax=Panagrolaimus davidi TaxID=227884 RepID=A0A914P628_9BILA
MVKRFNENDNSLNLNNLSNEKRLPPNLLTSIPGIFSLMKFIKRKYPHLNGISLKYNSLDNLQIVTSLAFICKSLKTLDVSYNKLNNINELEIVQICTKLDTVFLRHNPFSLKCLGLETYGR